MKSKTIVLILAMFSCVLTSQSQITFDSMLFQFFTHYGEGKTDEAVDYIFSTNIHLEGATQQISSIKEKLQTITSLIGPYYGYEKVIQREAGNSFVSVCCMVRHERQPLFFTFVFYKPDLAWQIQTLRFDDKLEEDELKELGNSVKK